LFINIKKACLLPVTVQGQAFTFNDRKNISNFQTMKRYFIIALLLIAAILDTRGQGAVDALRYSRLSIGGTARYMGMSGAFGALGGDFTVSSTNPAGLGIYSTSEMSITPSVFIGSTESLYNGEINKDSRANFALGNAGFVMTSRLDPRTSMGWKSVQFASGLNRLADFNNQTLISGFNAENSLLDTYVQAANGINYWDLEEDPYGSYAFDLSPAWWTYLLDLGDTSIYNQYISPVPGGNVQQTKAINTRGSMNEYVFSFAANYQDKLYLGATFGIPFIRYYEHSVYTESDIDGSIYDFSHFDRIEDVETHGNGFNFKFGMIYRLTDWMRIGASFHSPSWFSNMEDYWQVTMKSYFDNGDSYVRNSPSGNYQYDLMTPMRVQGNVGFIIGNVGLVSADYEWVDYSMARLSAYDYSFDEENRTITNSYKSGHNFRVGTEWRYNIFSFRGGVRYETSPYDNNLNDGSLLGFSAGLGFRTGPFFMDLAYAYTSRVEDYYLYNTTDIYTNAASNTARTSTVLTTFGLKF